MSVDAVVFDLDGVIIDSEAVWDEVREAYARQRGGRYDDAASHAMMGMSSIEWSHFMSQELGVHGAPEEINADVVELMAARYRERLPLVAGAADAVARLAEVFPLGLASSSNRPLIDAVLESAGLGQYFQATVSSEEVARGKPAPDVYLEAARRLDVLPTRCTAVEDSNAGTRSAKAAGMRVVVIPHPGYPLDEDALAQADGVLTSIDQLTPAIIESDG